VVCYAGDGCFQMNLQELGVAMQYRLGIVILVFNNGMGHDPRASGTRVPGPDDCARLRQSRVQPAGQGVSATARWWIAMRISPRLCPGAGIRQSRATPALIELRYEPDGIAPGVALRHSCRSAGAAIRLSDATRRQPTEPP
jgi:acetolactate synthase-1/2/3 large subunit